MKKQTTPASLCPLSQSAIDEIVSWARLAGEIALGHFKRVDPRQKPDKTFVTKADLEVEAFLVEKLRQAFPHFGLLGEEGARSEAAQDSTWVLDPIDGTTSFVQGLPGWGIALGLLHRGQPCFGLFYMPLLDDLTVTPASSATDGDNAPQFKRTVRGAWRHKDFVAVTSTAHRDFRITLPRTRTMGSAGANLIYTARGAAIGAFVQKAYLWDLAPGAAILHRAGGELRYLSGQTVDLLPLLDGRSAPEPIVAGHPDLLDELRSAFAARE